MGLISSLFFSFLHHLPLFAFLVAANRPSCWIYSDVRFPKSNTTPHPNITFSSTQTSSQYFDPFSDISVFYLHFLTTLPPAGLQCGWKSTFISINQWTNIDTTGMDGNEHSYTFTSDDFLEIQFKFALNLDGNFGIRIRFIGHVCVHIQRI